MLSLDQTLLFLPAVAIIIGIPGPDMLLSLSRGLSQGARCRLCPYLQGRRRHHGALATGGVWCECAADREPDCLLGHEAGGAAYLIYLGVQQWRSAATGAAPMTTKPAPLQVVFMRRVLSNLLNPKVALFVLAFVPQFVLAGDGAASPLVQMLLLGAIFSLLTIIAYSAQGPQLVA